MCCFACFLKYRAGQEFSDCLNSSENVSLPTDVFVRTCTTLLSRKVSSDQMELAVKTRLRKHVAPQNSWQPIGHLGCQKIRFKSPLSNSGQDLNFPLSYLSKMTWQLVLGKCDKWILFLIFSQNSFKGLCLGWMRHGIFFFWNRRSFCRMIKQFPIQVQLKIVPNQACQPWTTESLSTPSTMACFGDSRGRRSANNLFSRWHFLCCSFVLPWDDINNIQTHTHKKSCLKIWWRKSYNFECVSNEFLNSQKVTST